MCAACSGNHDYGDNCDKEAPFCDPSGELFYSPLHQVWCGFDMSPSSAPVTDCTPLPAAAFCTQLSWRSGTWLKGSRKAQQAQRIASDSVLLPPLMPAQLGSGLGSRDARWHCERSYEMKLAGGRVHLFFIDTNPFVMRYYDTEWANFTGGDGPQLRTSCCWETAVCHAVVFCCAFSDRQIQAQRLHASARSCWSCQHDVLHACMRTEAP
jgi:hypothetical protein